MTRLSALLVLPLLAGCMGAPEEPSPLATRDSPTVVKRSDRAGDAGSLDLPDPSADGPREVRWLANIGDSISQGFDADDSAPLDLNELASSPDSVFVDQPELSWIKGSDPRVGSVASHLRRLVPDLRVTSVSRSGAEVVGREGGLPNFEDQARALAAAGAKPDLVHVLLGGNDVCGRPPSSSSDSTQNMYSVERWRQGVVAGLSVLAETLPEGSEVRVSSMPRVDLLYDAAGDASVPVKAQVDSSYGAVTVDSTRTCKQLWSLAAWARDSGVCAIVTTERSDARRTRIGARIDAYNEALAREVRRFRDDRRLNPRGVVFRSDWHGSLASGAAAGSSVGTFAFTGAQVSKRDCFHPSVAGQRELASLVLTRARWE